MTIIIPSPQLLIHSKNKDYVTQISHREHKSRNLNSNLNSILDDCTINLSLMCFNGVNPAIHQARVYSSVIISDFIDLNNPKNPLFYGSLAASAKDFENAVYWYKIAAKRNSVTAMNAIGHIYLNMYKKIKSNTDYDYLNEDDDEDEDEEEEIYGNRELIDNKFLKYKKDLFYVDNPSKEALKWFYRAYKFGSIQSLQYIAMVFEAIGKKSEALHFYRKHYEKTAQYNNLLPKSKNNSFINLLDNDTYNLNETNFCSLYSKYKIAHLFNFFNNNNNAFLWFISCAEVFGHLKSIHKMLDIIKNEQSSENKSYSEIYSTIFHKLNNNYNYSQCKKEQNQTIERNIKLAKIISILKFKSIINSSVNNNNCIQKDTTKINDENNNDTNFTDLKNKPINDCDKNNNSDDKDNSKLNNQNDNSNNKNTNNNNTDNFNYNNENSLINIQNPKINYSSSCFESSICTDTALDINGWKYLQSKFTTDIFSKSSSSPKQQYSSKHLEVPSFKIASHAFWLTDPLSTNSRSILQFDPSFKSGIDTFITQSNHFLNLKGADDTINNLNSSNTFSFTTSGFQPSNKSKNKANTDHLLTISSQINSPPQSSSPSQFTTSLLKLYPPISPAFFHSGSKSQYLHLVFKFASPTFAKRNLQLSFLFLQKMRLIHPKGISESLLFRSRCKSRNPKHLIQCGFIAVLCHDSKFALDLFTKAAKLGNETGSLMTGLLMFHGLNVVRQVKNGCFYLSQCSTDPIALLHLSLACNDEIYEIRAKETLGIYSSSFQYNPQDSIRSVNPSSSQNGADLLNKSTQNDFLTKKNNEEIDFDDDSKNSNFNARYRMYEWVGDLFSNSVKLPLNVGISLMFYGIALKKAEEDGDEIRGIIKKISLVSREPGLSK